MKLIKNSIFWGLLFLVLAVISGFINIFLFFVFFLAFVVFMLAFAIYQSFKEVEERER